jgi:hypothetical protein
VVLPSIHRKSIFATVTELAKPVRHPEVLYFVVKVSIAAIIYSFRHNVTIFWVYEDWKQMFFCITRLWELRVSCGWINLYDYSIVCLRRFEHYFRVRCYLLYSHLRLNLLLANIISLIVEQVILMLNAINWKKFLERRDSSIFTEEQNRFGIEIHGNFKFSGILTVYPMVGLIAHRGVFINTRCCCKRYLHRSE